METFEREIEHEELARRIREASMRARTEAERAAADFDAANADGLRTAFRGARHPHSSPVE